MDAVALGTQYRSTHSTLTSSSEQYCTAQYISEELNNLGVFTLSRARRVACAVAIVHSGHQIDDVILVWEHIKQCYADDASARRAMAAVVADAERFQAAVQDVHLHLAAKGKCQEQQAPGERIRQENTRRVHEFDREWESWRQRKAAGLEEPVPRLVMPWER